MSSFRLDRTFAGDTGANNQQTDARRFLGTLKSGHRRNEVVCQQRREAGKYLEDAVTSELAPYILSSHRLCANSSTEQRHGLRDKDVRSPDSRKLELAANAHLWDAESDSDPASVTAITEPLTGIEGTDLKTLHKRSDTAACESSAQDALFHRSHKKQPAAGEQQPSSSWVESNITESTTSICKRRSYYYDRPAVVAAFEEDSGNEDIFQRTDRNIWYDVSRMTARIATLYADLDRCKADSDHFAKLGMLGGYTLRTSKYFRALREEIHKVEEHLKVLDEASLSEADPSAGPDLARLYACDWALPAIQNPFHRGPDAPAEDADKTSNAHLPVSTCDTVDSETPAIASNSSSIDDATSFPGYLHELPSIETAAEAVMTRIDNGQETEVDLFREFTTLEEESR